LRVSSSPRPSHRRVPLRGDRFRNSYGASLRATVPMPIRALPQPVLFGVVPVLIYFQILLEVRPQSDGAAAHCPWVCIIIQRLTVEERIEVRNPATGERVGEVQTIGPSELEAAARVARDAQRVWSRSDFKH